MSSDKKKNMDSSYVVNPFTGRPIKVGGKVYKKIMRMSEEENALDSPETNTEVDTNTKEDLEHANSPRVEKPEQSPEELQLKRTASHIVDTHYDALLSAYRDPTVDIKEWVDALLLKNNYVASTVNDESQPCPTDPPDT